jgi:hypothetical protein
MNSREQLSCVFVHLEQFPGCVVIEVEQSTADIFTSVNGGLVCTLPCLDVYNGHSSIKCSEVLKD